MTPCWCQSSCAAAERPQLELSYKCCTTGFWDSANLASPAFTDLLRFLPVLVFPHCGSLPHQRWSLTEGRAMFKMPKNLTRRLI